MGRRQEGRGRTAGFTALLICFVAPYTCPMIGSCDGLDGALLHYATPRGHIFLLSKCSGRSTQNDDRPAISFDARGRRMQVIERRWAEGRGGEGRAGAARALSMTHSPSQRNQVPSQDETNTPAPWGAGDVSVRASIAGRCEDAVGRVARGGDGAPVKKMNAMEVMKPSPNTWNPKSTAEGGRRQGACWRGCVFDGGEGPQQWEET